MPNDPTPDPKAMKRLARGIIKEVIDKGFADIWDESWNPKAHIEVTLTVAEIRCAASIINFHPTKAQLRNSEEANDWHDYINALDGME